MTFFDHYIAGNIEMAEATDEENMDTMKSLAQTHLVENGITPFQNVWVWHSHRICELIGCDLKTKVSEVLSIGQFVCHMLQYAQL